MYLRRSFCLRKVIMRLGKNIVYTLVLGFIILRMQLRLFHPLFILLQITVGVSHLPRLAESSSVTQDKSSGVA